MNIYLAGAITGQSKQDVVNKIKFRRKKLEKMGYSIVGPVIDLDSIRTDVNPNEKDFKSSLTSHAIFERDKWMVSNCDIFIADLTGMNLSIGTTMELAWACLLGKHTIAVIPNLEYSVYNHAFIKESCDAIFPDEEQMFSYLEVMRQYAKV